MKDDILAHLYEEKVVSLNLELANLEHALRGAQLLADFLANNDMPTADAVRQAPRSVVAILALTDARLQQLRRVIRSEADARHLWAPHNATSPESLPGDADDVRLESRTTPGSTAAPSSRKHASGKTKRKLQAKRTARKTAATKPPESPGAEEATAVPVSPAKP
ncbi:hypothetical protein [Myxococcus sp. RHSTA-1-4]|uniref:hypothetical protein n=1 Tax=Myxococcus sp. RHSTA-1-4 TaxID=2874601 RepID=UPI001CBE0060|nr:hypothetical protein [Myxococcus sp. RHSTA-1-4]MBZ4421764.1 hypothetical protein [Myxococcus sp. RHSTA-1-4]